MLTNTPCIYAIRCIVTNKLYIGSALKGLTRCRHHFRGLVQGKHHNNYLQNAWNKHGADSFTCELIEACSVEDLREREQFWINFHGSADTDKGYNIAYPVRQRLPSKRMSTRHKQYWAALTEEEYQERVACYADEEFKERVRAVRNHPDYIKNISEKASERWAREEFRSKMDVIFTSFWLDPEKRAEAVRVRVENVTKNWEDNPQRRKATSESKIALWQEPEYRKERTQGTTELWKDPEYRNKVTDKVKASCNTPEYRAALSERVKLQWAKRKAEKSKP